MRKTITLIAALGLITLNAAAPACLDRFTLQRSPDHMTNSSYFVDAGRTRYHAEVWQSESFVNMDLLMQIYVTDMNGVTTQVANQWELARYGIVYAPMTYDSPLCGTTKRVELRVYGFQHGTLMQISYSSVIAEVP